MTARRPRRSAKRTADNPGIHGDFRSDGIACLAGKRCWLGPARAGARVRGLPECAWSQLAEPNLRNKAGLPAGAFRTTATAPTIVGQPLFVKDCLVELVCEESDSVIRYTVDGSLPTETAPAYEQPIRLSESATIRARFYRNTGIKSAVAQATFAKVQPRQYQGKTLAPGVRYEYYEGAWKSLPDFALIEPKKTGLRCPSR